MSFRVSWNILFFFSFAGCSFGGRFYSLEDTWHPDLGEPFGVMHCVQCHCEPVSPTSVRPQYLWGNRWNSTWLSYQNASAERHNSVPPVEIWTVTNMSASLFFPWQQKSRRGKVFGKVNCKNIKQDCPDPDCDDPVLLPGHCCKTCPKSKNPLMQMRPSDAPVVWILLSWWSRLDHGVRKLASAAQMTPKTLWETIWGCCFHAISCSIDFPFSCNKCTFSLTSHDWKKPPV